MDCEINSLWREEFAPSPWASKGFSQKDRNLFLAGVKAKPHASTVPKSALRFDKTRLPRECKLKKNQVAVFSTTWLKRLIQKRKEQLARGNGYREKPKPTETILSDILTGRVIKDIDEHIFLRMTGEIAGKDLDEFFFVFRVGLNESFCHIKPMRSLAAIEPNPVAGALGTQSIQPVLVFVDSRLNLPETQTLSRSDRREQQR
jgi:hypothetical protein